MTHVLLDLSSGLDSSVSPSIRGIVDFVAPVKFGKGLLPSSSVHYIGDEISATFSEDVDCRRPHSFSVTILVETLTPVTLSGSDLVIYCKDSQIMFEVSSSSSFQVCSFRTVPFILQLDDAIGRKITITLDGVRDLAGNPLKLPLVWSATISVRANTATSNILFSGLRVRVASTSVTPSFLTNLASSLASRLRVSPSSLINFKWTPSANGVESIFSFEIVTTTSGGFRRDVSSQEAADMLLSDEFGDDFLSAWLAKDHEVRH